MLYSIISVDVQDVESVNSDKLVTIKARQQGVLAKAITYRCFLDEDTCDELIDTDAGTVLGKSTIELDKVTREVPSYQHVDDKSGEVFPQICSTLSAIIQPGLDDPDEAVRKLYSRMLNKGLIQAFDESDDDVELTKLPNEL